MCSKHMTFFLGGFFVQWKGIENVVYDTQTEVCSLKGSLGTLRSQCERVSDVSVRSDLI